jgi:EAL domain-containing protein (putative c-di-GMP-specific phosphodiesterase class I)/GGDEF domain-containing protein
MDADLVGPAGTDATAAPTAVPRPAVAPPSEPRDGEPLLLAALAAGGALAAWTTGAGSGPWSATLAVAVLAGSAWLAERDGPGRRSLSNPAGLRLARAVLCLAAAAVAVGGHPGPAPVALAWLPAVAAVYAVLLPPRPAAALTLGALAVVTVLAARSTATARPSTAFAACAAAVVAAGLAGATLRAVRTARTALDPDTEATAVTPDVTPDVTSDVALDETPDAAPAPLLTSPDGRSVLLDALARAQARSGVVGGRVGLLLVTLDGAAALQRDLGAAAAREVLDTLARRARALLPAADVVTWIGDGRLGVVLEGVDARTCSVVARRLAGLLGEPVEAAGQVLVLSSRVAVALAADPREEPSALLARAELVPAVPAAELPLDRPVPTTPALPDRLADELWPALCAGDIRAAYQPIVALGTLPRHDRVVAVEALARWARPDGAGVAPTRLVAAARRAGLADALGGAVLAQGLDELVRRRAAGAAALGLAVNVAPEQLARPGFAAEVFRALAARDVEAPALTLELPVAGGLEGVPEAPAALRELRAGGVRIVLDNFGVTGLSLASLRELPLTGVKLDRSLTAELGGDDRLVVATARLATRLGLHCTAVGIETPEQLDAARALGMDAVQGHLLGRPESGTRPGASTDGTEPAPTQPDGTGPAPTEPGGTGPAPTEPGAIEPAAPAGAELPAGATETVINA